MSINEERNDKQFIENFSKEILEHLIPVLQKLVNESAVTKNPKSYLKGSEVRKMLGGISDNTLKQLRINGDIPSVQMSTGTWLYPYHGIVDAVESKMRGGKS